MTITIGGDLAPKTALVTGSSRGIGAGLAAALEEAGLRVLRHGSQARPGQDLLVADLADPAGPDSLARQVKERTEVVDLLVNNAGLELTGRLEELEPTSLRQVLEINLTAPLLLTRALLPLLRRAGAASVVNVTSIHDDIPIAGNLAYVASKAGLEAATRTLALELASDGIRVNTIAPGAIETDMNSELIETIGRDQFNDWIPLGRVGTTADLTGPLLFLASDASRYMTGARLLIDGGYSLNLVRYGLTK
jgi:NAD(P)-dependent dehydrogenase (short-subunit alcohol dehydrogenase family)